MARTVIPIQTLSANGVDNDITWTAGDATNDMYFMNTGKEALIFRSDTAGAKAATVVSVPDEHGRTGDIAMAPSGDKVEAIVANLNPSIWNQRGSSDLGRVHVDLTDDTGTKFAVVRLP